MSSLACPLFLPHDWLILHHDISFKGGLIYDRTLGAQHTVSTSGHLLLKLIAKGGTYNTIRMKALQAGIRDEQLITAFSFLHTMGGLVRIRRTRDWPEAIIISARSALLGIFYAAAVQRQTASEMAIIKTLVSCIRPIALTACMSVYLLMQAGFGDSRTIIMVSCWMLALFTLSLILHELAHYYLIRRHSDVVVLRQGMRIGLIHRPLAPSDEWRSAVAGPLAGAVFCALAGFFWLGFGSHAMAAASLVAGSFHGGSLLPWYADGTILWRKQATSNA
jgi:hypothetical protein